MRVWRWLLLVAFLGLSGCVSIAAHDIEHPGHAKPSAKLVRILGEAPPHYRQRNFRTRDGLRIAYWYGTPQALDITDQVSVKPTSFSFNFSWKAAANKHRPATHGSVVLLHSWGLNPIQMIYWSLHFTNAGYVVVMPALRSEGDSGNAPVGYGPREAGDIEQLIQHLQKNHELPPPLYLLGYSYGATVALFTEPYLPHLRGVIAMAPYVHPVDVIERAPRTSLFTPPWWPHFLPQYLLQNVFSPHVMHAAIARADRKLDLDLAAIDPGDAMARAHVCTLLLRGDSDQLTSREATKALMSHSPQTQFVSVAHANHMTLFLRTDELFQPILDWMQTIHTGDSATCPAFVLHPERQATPFR